MNKKTQLARVAAVAASICITCPASPTIREGSVTITQAEDRQVSIRYTLDDEPAIVTVDILTNNVSIGYANIQNIAGDVKNTPAICLPCSKRWSAAASPAACWKASRAGSC